MYNFQHNPGTKVFSVLGQSVTKQIQHMMKHNFQLYVIIDYPLKNKETTFLAWHTVAQSVPSHGGKILLSPYWLAGGTL